ncbi:MAG: hypothetical protein L6R41_008142 [Letrouitia leprolyta]|nr:MAG: hypothetical protein L6R41_008142 [Letrouitia leprolyta]
MKVTSIVFAALLAVASAEAAAATPKSAEEICNLPGQPCNKMKRAAEAVAEAIAEPEADPKYNGHLRWCYRRGQACGKAKRDALALAEAVAEAHAAANPQPAFGKFFFLLHIQSQEADQSPEAADSKDFCYSDGQACSKVKRAADAIAKAIADPEAYRGRWCHRPGEPCGKNKRALEDLSSVVEKIRSEY